MPIPADDFFDAWEAELPEHEKATFCRDGVVDEDAWKDAAVRILFVADRPNPKDDTAGNLSELPYDLREVTREHGGGGSYGTPLARWAAMILTGLSAEEAGTLKRKELKEDICKTARICLKKCGGDDDAEDIKAWALKHGERLEQQIDAIDPQIIVVCGDGACAAWPVWLADDRTAKQMWRSQEFEWEGKSILGTLSPAAPGTKTADKDADVERFAASPELVALRGK